MVMTTTINMVSLPMTTVIPTMPRMLTAAHGGDNDDGNDGGDDDGGGDDKADDDNDHDDGNDEKDEDALDRWLHSNAEAWVPCVSLNKGDEGIKPSDETLRPGENCSRSPYI